MTDVFNIKTFSIKSKVVYSIILFVLNSQDFELLMDLAEHRYQE